jgi:MFS transporter, DHA2 family, multidrug resistance protein
MTPLPSAPTVTRTNWVAMAAVGLSVYMATLDMTIVTTALPTIGRSFHSSPIGTQWVLLVYNLAMIALIIPLGRWVDEVGKRTALLFAIAGFAVASALCGIIGDLAGLLILRAIQGTFAALISALVLAVTVLVIAPQERGRAMGVIGVLGPLGSVSGPVLGSLIISHLSWRWLFFVNVPISAIAFILVAVTVKTPGRLRAPAPSWVGTAVLVAGCFTLLLLGIDRLSSGSSLVGALMLVGAAVLGAVWSRTSDAASAFAVLRVRPMPDLNLSLLMTSMTGGALYFLMPYILEQHMGRTVGQVGSIMFAMPLTMGIVGYIGGHASDRFGDWRALMAGTVCTTVGVALLIAQGTHWGTLDTILRLGVVGIGMGLFVAPNQSAVMRFAPRERMGMASSLSGLSRSLGFTFGPAIGAVAIAGNAGVSMSLIPPLVTALGAVAAGIVAVDQIRRRNAESQSSVSSSDKPATAAR